MWLRFKPGRGSIVCVGGGEISGLTCALSQLTGLNDFSRVHVNGTA